MHAMLAARCKELPEPTRLVGVYFLLCKGKLVYVGSSEDIEKRLYSHRHAQGRHRMRFDSIVWLPIPVEDLRAYEGALIRCLTPKYNRVAPTSGRDLDDEILAALGLPPVADDMRGRYWLDSKTTIRRRLERERAAGRLSLRKSAADAAIAAATLARLAGVAA